MKVELIAYDAPDAAESDPLSRAAEDLLTRVRDAAPRRIAVLCADAGCAPSRLARRFPRAAIEALDLFGLDRDASGQAGVFDLIHSNGDLPWRPAARRLLPKLMARLAFGGALAAQFPDDLYEPYRALARMIAADGPWADTLVPVAKTRPYNPSMDVLHALLSPVSTSLDIWETTYLLAYDGVEAIVGQMRAGALAPFLAPFLAPLDASARDLFIERYRAELRVAYPPQSGGRTLLKFPRIFVIARR